MSVGMTPFGLIFRYSGECCSIFERSTMWPSYFSPFSSRHRRTRREALERQAWCSTRTGFFPIGPMLTSAMTVKLNHHIVHARNKRASAEFYESVFGFGKPVAFGPFLGVQTGNEVTLDFFET